MTRPKPFLGWSDICLLLDMPYTTVRHTYARAKRKLHRAAEMTGLLEHETTHTTILANYATPKSANLHRRRANGRAFYDPFDDPFDDSNPLDPQDPL
jgi:hypothetical protein